MQQDEAQVSDKVETTLTPSQNGPQMVRVVVTAEAGIFKNGVHYAKGQGAYISLDAAQKFENVGEVKTLLGEGSSQPIAPTPPTLGNEAVNA